MEGPIPQTEKMLADSTEQYRELLQHAEQLRDLLAACQFEQLGDHAARLQEMQEAATRHDEHLLPLIEKDVEYWQTHDLFRTRQGFIEAILDLNKLLLPKIHGMMAIASAELGQLRGGRVALAGYAAPTCDRRGLRGVG